MDYRVGLMAQFAMAFQGLYRSYGTDHFRMNALKPIAV